MQGCIRSSLVLNNLLMDGIMIQSVGGVISSTPKDAANRKSHDDWICWDGDCTCTLKLLVYILCQYNSHWDIFYIILLPSDCFQFLGHFGKLLTVCFAIIIHSMLT